MSKYAYRGMHEQTVLTRFRHNHLHFSEDQLSAHRFHRTAILMRTRIMRGALGAGLEHGASLPVAQTVFARTGFDGASF